MTHLDTGRLHPGMPSDIKSEWRAKSSRNPGDFRRNQQPGRPRGADKRTFLVLDPELEGLTQAVIQGSRERRPLMPLGRPMPMIGNSTE